MNIIGRIKLPKSANISQLYIQCNEAAIVEEQEASRRVMFHQGGVLSSSSYFNSFYESYYAKYTSLSSIYYLLNLEGDFRIVVYRESNEKSEKILEDTFEHCQLSTPIKLSSIDFNLENAGRTYVEITCLSEQGVFEAGWIATDQPRPREVSLGIAICTFKKESYIRNTVSALLQDELLQDKALKLFISDNGRTLEPNEFKDSRVNLFPNMNAGGSGGFTRGIIEILAEGSSSHLLLMDDDIELETESIFRLFSIHEYAKTEFIVAGGLLNLNQKTSLYEAGATHNDDPRMRGIPNSLTALNHRLDLTKPEVLNQLLIEEEPDYGGFWFCSFSRELVDRIKLPLPLFIKIDDVEFCLRAKKDFGIAIATFPNLAVWHLPASAKDLNWETYYYFRNDLITYSMHYTPNYSYAVSNYTKEILQALLKQNFDRAQMLIQAFEDYLKGPALLKDNNPEETHPVLLKLSRTYDNQERIDRGTRLKLLMRWSTVASKGRDRWSIASREWKEAYPELTSLAFWQAYLRLKEPAISSR